MKKVIRLIFDFFEVHLPAFIFILLLVTVTMAVFSRYVLNEPTPKLFELSIYCFVWLIYLGAALAKRYDKHIRFDILYRHLPRRVQLGLDIVFDTLTNAALIYLVVPSFKYTIWSYNIKASSLRVPWSFLLVCFPLFLVLLLIHNTVDIFYNIREVIGGKKRVREVPPWH